MKNCSKLYQGQALAISMIILVVCAILGASIYARVIKDRTLVTEEAVSSEALEIADSLLGTVSTIPVAQLMEYISSQDEDGDGTVEYDGREKVDSFLEGLGLVNTLDEFYSLEECTTDNSTMQMVVAEATIDDLIEVRVDEAKAFRISGKTILETPCNLNLRIESRGTTNSGFAVKKIYATGYEDTPDYKIYEEDDIRLYCFSDDLALCNSDDFIPDDNWNKFTDGDTLEIDLSEEIGGYRLDEVRIIPVGGTIGIGSAMSSETCLNEEDLGAVRVVANITCDDIYRAKEMLIPEEGATSYSSIFDFAVYNNIGVLDL